MFRHGKVTYIFCKLIMKFYVFRGNKFRVSFARLGELRSLLPVGVNIIALTATATTTTLDVIKARLSMPCPMIIGLPPHRSNMSFIVQPYVSIIELGNHLMGKFLNNYPDVQKMVIYCQSLNISSQLYKYLVVLLRQRHGEPSARIIDMFNKACSVKKREEVLKLFCKDDVLRVIIASSAFGMGVDCPNIRTVIHLGPPDTLDTYIQESGRAGRDGQISQAVLLYGHAGRYVTDGMKHYGENLLMCRRKLLYQNFLFSDTIHSNVPKNVCCDVCCSQVLDKYV